MKYTWTPPDKHVGLPAPEPETEPQPATIKPGWRLPVPPACPECGRPSRAAVYHTGDGWVWGYNCTGWCGPDPFWWDDGCEGAGEPWGWPFVEDYALDTDWERAGVWVV